MRSTFLACCGAIAVALTASACGGGGYDGGGNPTTPTPPTTPPASTTIAIAGDRGAQSFSPNPGSAAQGQSIAWRNNDNQIHRIVANDGSFDTGNIAPGATSNPLTLGTNGTNYHCSLHTGMVGAINASSGAPPPCTGPYC
jgi:plastocyanin